MNKPTQAIPTPERRRIVLVLSSPSGAGKTTLAKRLLATDAGIRASVSVTTRPPRPSETDGVDYTFIEEAEFLRRRDDGELLEWAKVFGYYYGTPRQSVTDMLEAGFDVLFDIDWQGAQQLAERASQDLVRVFVLPPSAESLEQRLRDRAQDSELVVAQRMARASEEISHWGEYDYVIVNDDLDRSAGTLAAILQAERQRRDRLIGLPEFVRRMQDAL